MSATSVSGRVFGLPRSALATSATPLCLVLIAAAWSAFYLPRIFTLGFDADEWIYYVHWHNLAIGERFQYLMELMSARPGLVLLLSIFPTIAGPSPMIPQAFCAVASLVIALQIFFLCTQLETESTVAAGLAAMTWMFIPWSMSYTAWGLMLVGLISTSLFLLCFGLAMRRRQTWSTMLGASAALLGSLLSYEAFTFCFLAPLAYRVADQSYDRKDTVRLSVALAVAQAAALGVNRWLHEGSKTITWNLASALAGIIHLPQRMLEQTSALSGISAAVIGVWFALVAAMFIYQVRRSGKLRILIPIFTLLALCAANVTLYNLAGLAMSFERRAARVFLTVDLLLVLLLFQLISRAAKGFAWRQTAAASLFGFILAAFAIGLSAETARWQDAWSSVLRALSAAPNFANMPEGSAVIYNGPTNRAGFTFLGNIELTAAMYWRHPETAIKIAPPDPASFRRRPENYGWFIPSENKMPVLFFTTGEGVAYLWDGKVLT